MSIFNQVKVDESKKTGGIWIDDVLPSGDLQLLCRPALGPMNKQFRALFERLTQPYRALLDRGKAIPPKESAEIWAECLVKTVVLDAKVFVPPEEDEQEGQFVQGLDRLEDGTIVPFTKDHLEELLKTNDVFRFRLIECVQDPSRFFLDSRQADAKN